MKKKRKEVWFLSQLYIQIYAVFGSKIEMNYGKLNVR